MAIQVVCPGCKKSFSVDDKFAGKTGPCPKCKTKITIPEKKPEVTIHAPDEFSGGGKGTTGKLLLKPIARQETHVKPAMVAIIGGSIVAAIAWALVVRWLGPSPGEERSWAYILFAGTGLLLVSPPLAVAAYTFLRDVDLEAYRGKQLYLRAAVCALVYMILWAVFVYVKTIIPFELPLSVLIAAPFLVVGTLAGKFAFDLEGGNGFFHYAFYVAATMILGAIAGMGWVWQ